MAATQTITLTLKPSGTPVNHTVQLTDEGELSLDAAVETGVTNQLAAFTVDIAKTKMLLLSSNSDVTIKTNSTSSPGDTIVLLAGVPLLWFTGCHHAFPLTAAVTALYITNASGQQAQVKARTLYHS